MSNSINNPTYGVLDTSYKAAGKEEGLRALSTDFYQIMNNLPQAKIIREMHKEDLTIMIDKLTSFLSMWLGGAQNL